MNALCDNLLTNSVSFYGTNALNRHVQLVTS